MFTTNESFKSSVQFDRCVTSWRAVELMIGHPFLYVQLELDCLHRHLLLNGMDDLLAIYEQPAAGRIGAISLLQPPAWSSTGEFQCLRMVEMLYQAAPPDDSAPSALVRDSAGNIYGGHPVKKLSGPLGVVNLMLKF